MVQNYDDFCARLLDSGFSMAGGNTKGIYAVVPFDWTEQPEGTPVRWHTGDPETDPWEWRMRVLNERNDIAYSKVFFRTSGYITRELYPYFLAVRRPLSFDEEWTNGGISAECRRVYDEIRTRGRLATHELRAICGGEGLQKALTELQMRLFITICGFEQKRNKFGEPYGWHNAVYCTTESFWGGDISSDLDGDEAFELIRERVRRFSPQADDRTIKKFKNG